MIAKARSRESTADSQRKENLALSPMRREPTARGADLARLDVIEVPEPHLGFSTGSAGAVITRATMTATGASVRSLGVPVGPISALACSAVSTAITMLRITEIQHCRSPKPRRCPAGLAG